MACFESFFLVLTAAPYRYQVSSEAAHSILTEHQSWYRRSVGPGPDDASQTKLFLYAFAWFDLLEETVPKGPRTGTLIRDKNTENNYFSPSHQGSAIRDCLERRVHAFDRHDITTIVIHFCGSLETFSFHFRPDSAPLFAP